MMRPWRSRKPRQLWPRVISEAKGALQGQTLVSQAKQSAVAVLDLLEAYTAAEEKGMQESDVTLMHGKRDACSSNLRGLLSDVKKLTECSEGSKEATEAHDELSASVKLLEDLCEGAHMQKAVRTADEVIGKFWAAGPDGQAAPIRLASSPVDGSSWLQSGDQDDSITTWFPSLAAICFWDAT